MQVSQLECLPPPPHQVSALTACTAAPISAVTRSTSLHTRLSSSTSRMTQANCTTSGSPWCAPAALLALLLCGAPAGSAVSLTLKHCWCDAKQEMIVRLRTSEVTTVKHDDKLVVQGCQGLSESRASAVAGQTSDTAALSGLLTSLIVEGKRLLAEQPNDWLYRCCHGRWHRCVGGVT